MTDADILQRLPKPAAPLMLTARQQDMIYNINSALGDKVERVIAWFPLEFNSHATLIVRYVGSLQGRMMNVGHEKGGRGDLSRCARSAWAGGGAWDGHDGAGWVAGGAIEKEARGICP